MMMRVIKFTTGLTLAAAVFVHAGCETIGGAETPSPALTALPNDAARVQPLDVGERAPALRLPAADGRRANLSRLYRKQPTVLVFYRGGWCPFCTEHLSELGMIESELREKGFQIIGVSPDRPEKLRESLRDQEITYRLLSDSDAELARAFGVAFHVDEETYNMLLGHDMDIEEASGRKHRVLPVPAVYLIDRNGIIRFAEWNPDYRDRISGEKLLEAADSMLGS